MLLCRCRSIDDARPLLFTALIVLPVPDTDWVELLLGDRRSDRTCALRAEDAQVFFEVGDRVRFGTTGSVTLTGTIEKLNPTRARVRSGAGVWAVPYAGLDHHCGSTAAERRRRAARLNEVAARARELMDRHGLAEWALRFNGARRKLGECRPRRKLILLSRSHAVHASSVQVTDTILHEIAHALAGPAAKHGPAWKAIARRLGAAPKSCAPESDEARLRRKAARASFRVGDAVRFVARGKHRSGTIVRMNPKRARVQCGDATWSVPYTRLSATA